MPSVCFAESNRMRLLGFDLFSFVLDMTGDTVRGRCSPKGNRRRTLAMEEASLQRNSGFQDFVHCKCSP